MLSDGRCPCSTSAPFRGAGTRLAHLRNRQRRHASGRGDPPVVGLPIGLLPARSRHPCGQSPTTSPNKLTRVIYTDLAAPRTLKPGPLASTENWGSSSVFAASNGVLLGFSPESGAGF